MFEFFLLLSLSLGERQTPKRRCQWWFDDEQEKNIEIQIGSNLFSLFVYIFLRKSILRVLSLVFFERKKKLKQQKGNIYKSPPKLHAHNFLHFFFQFVFIFFYIFCAWFAFVSKELHFDLVIWEFGYCRLNQEQILASI